MPRPYFAIEDPIVDGQTGQATKLFGLLCRFWHELFRGSPQKCFIQWGTGAPETVIVAPVGSLFIRTNGGVSTTLYIKEANTDATGWRAV